MADLPSRVDALEKGFLGVARLSAATVKGKAKSAVAGSFFVLLLVSFARAYLTFSESGRRVPQPPAQQRGEVRRAQVGGTQLWVALTLREQVLEPGSLPQTVASCSGCPARGSGSG